MSGPASAYLTPPQVARQLGVKASKIAKWIFNQQLLAVNVAENLAGRPRWKISQASLDEFLAARSNRKPATKATRRRRNTLQIQEFFV